MLAGRIFKVPIAPQDRHWMWASGHNRHYEPTREAAMAAFAKGLEARAIYVGGKTDEH
jgi:hypothetical protein